MNFPLCLDTEISSEASAEVGTNGFSTKTCLPACKAALAKGKCVSGVVVMTMISIDESANIASAEL